MNEIHELEIYHKAEIAFLAGMIDAWAITLDKNPEMYLTVIKSMKKHTTSLKKKIGLM